MLTARWSPLIRNTRNLNSKEPAIIFVHTAVPLLFDDNKIKMARRPAKKQKENLAGSTGEGKR